MNSRPVVETALRSALQYLERASDSWHNGTAVAEGPLHWPVAVREAKCALCVALEILTEPGNNARPPHCGALEMPERATPCRAVAMPAAIAVAAEESQP